MIWRRLKRLVSPDRSHEIWRGVYESYPVGKAAGTFEAGSWFEGLVREYETVREGEVRGDFRLEHELLVMLAQRGPSSLRIVDFGGGLGASLLVLDREVAAGRVASYQIVELPAVAQRAAELQNLDPRLRFASRLGAFAREPDILFVKSALQYVPDYRLMLDEIFAFGAAHVLLEKFSGVHAPTYAALQMNVEGAAIPYWFISFDEVFAVAERHGYVRSLWRRLPRRYDQSTYAVHLRMDQASTLLFERRGLLS